MPIKSNRVGPHNFMDIENTPFEPDQTAITNATNVFDTLEILLRTVAVNSDPDIQTENFVLNGKTIASHATNYNIFGIGTLINGEILANDPRYLTDLSGSINLAFGDTDMMNVMPILARADGALSTSLTVTKYAVIPCSSFAVYDNQINASFNLGNVIGNWQGQVSEMDETDWVLAWMMGGVHTAGLTMYGAGSLSIHRYVSPQRIIETEG